MFVKNFSQCQRLRMTGKNDQSIQVEIVEMFRPEDGFDLAFNVAQFCVPAKKRTDKYFLKSISETWFIKEGSGVAEIDGKQVPMDKETVLHISAGQTRCFINTGKTPLVYFSVAQPPFRPDDVESLDETDVQISS